MSIEDIVPLINRAFPRKNHFKQTHATHTTQQTAGFGEKEVDMSSENQQLEYARDTKCESRYLYLMNTQIVFNVLPTRRSH
jgi:hypothetical protein